MFRLSYIVPRLVVVFAFCLFVRFGLDPLLQWSLVGAGQTVSGARVDVDRLVVSPQSTAAYLEGVQVADPRSPLNNLIEFDRAWLKVDGQALMHRRLVIDHGVITGLEFDSDRATSGAIERTEPTETKSIGLSAEQLAGLNKWLDDLAGKIGRDVDEQFQSVRLTRELTERWPQDYEATRARIEQWRERVAKIQALAQELREKKLQNLAAWQDGLRQLDELRAETEALRKELGRLKQQVAIDKQSIATAKEHDLAKLRELASIRELRGKELSDYLLGEELSSRVALWLTRLRRGQQAWEFAMQEPELNKLQGRGFNVPFGSTDPQPRFLMRQLAVQGQAASEGELLAFTAQLRGVTSHPRRYGQPATLDIDVPGPPTVRLHAEFDYTSDTPRQLVTIDCPNWQQNEMRLGTEDRLAMHVAPGAARLSIRVELVGDQLDGQIDWQQDRFSMTPTLASNYGGQYLNEPLASSVDAIQQVGITVALTGTLEQPRYEFSSNLGPQLADGWNATVTQQLELWSQRLKDKADALVAEQLAKADQYLQTKQAELLEQMQIGDEELAGLQQILGGKRQIAEQVLGKFPLNKLF